MAGTIRRFREVVAPTRFKRWADPRRWGVNESVIAVDVELVAAHDAVPGSHNDPVGAGPVDLERLAWIEVVEAPASVVDGWLRQLVIRLARLEQREVGVARAGVDGDLDLLTGEEFDGMDDLEGEAVDDLAQRVPMVTGGPSTVSSISSNGTSADSSTVASPSTRVA